MSGIFGIINFDGCPVDQADLTRMSNIMAHRGPDTSNTYLDNDVGFGQLMLCSTPESLTERLPWKDPLSGLLITADVRIDNRDELATALGVDFGPDTIVPDSQLILAAYRKWGEACVGHLLGDFAFAIWDEKNQRLFVARDHMGIRPFYYYSCGEFFVFASAANAIARVQRIPVKINEGRVADFLIGELEGINNTTTFFENIHRMPPAHFGLVENGKTSFSGYWRPDPETRLHLGSNEEYADALEETLTLAIEPRMRSHRPIASMLSGGADSSTITGIARKICRNSGEGIFRTYSGISDNASNCCESRFIRLVIDHGGLDPVLLCPSSVKNYTADFERISDNLEDPFGDSWAILRLIYLSAREKGNVVVMDGMGGDLVTGITTGYPSYLLRQGNLKHAFHETNAMRKNFHENRIGLWKAHYQSIRPALTPEFARRLKASLWLNRIAKPCYDGTVLSEDFAKKVNLPDRWKEYKGQSTSGFCPSLRHKHAETLVVPFLTAAIERYERIASSCGVESRQPFHDKRVVELCLSMPWQQKAQDGWMKYCLRNVLQRVAPAEVAWRTEFDSIMWKFGVAWNELNSKKNLAIIARNREQLLEIVDATQLDQMLAGYENGDIDAMHPIWNLVTLLNWLKNNQLELPS